MSVRQDEPGPVPLTGSPRIAVVIVNYKTAALTCLCLEALYRLVPADSFEAVVVDNASGDDSVAHIAQRFPQVQLLALPRNVGFGEGNNRGVAATTAPCLVLLNSDALLKTNTPAALADFLDAHADVACVGPRIDLPDGSRQPRVFGNRPSAWRVAMQSWGLAALAPRSRLFGGIDGAAASQRVTRVGWISGVCMAMRRTQFVAVGGFDPAIFMYCEDVDLCARLQQAHGSIVHVDDWAVEHLGGASSPALASRLRNAVWQQRNLLLVLRKQHGLAGDAASRVAMAMGHALRMAAGLLRWRRDGGYLLRSSWLRLLDLFGLQRQVAL